MIKTCVLLTDNHINFIPGDYIDVRLTGILNKIIGNFNREGRFNKEITFKIPSVISLGYDTATGHHLTEVQQSSKIGIDKSYFKIELLLPEMETEVIKGDIISLPFGYTNQEFDIFIIE